MARNSGCGGLANTTPLGRIYPRGSGFVRVSCTAPGRKDRDAFSIVQRDEKLDVKGQTGDSYRDPDHDAFQTNEHFLNSRKGANRLRITQ